MTPLIRRPRSASAPAKLTAWLCIAASTPFYAALAAGHGDTRAAIEARYRAERQACLDGSSGQVQSACLREASAARAEALKYGLEVVASPDAYLANALARCKVHAPADRADCERLVRGEGTQSGSVQAGGVIREITNVTPTR